MSIASLPDDVYIAGVQRSDEAIFTALVRAYIDPLTRFAYGFTGLEDLAHDIVQDVFANVWELGQDWKPKGSVAAYLFVAVRHRAFNAAKAARANQRMREAYRLWVERNQLESNPYVDLALSAAVDQAYEQLTDRQRESLRLRYEQGFTLPQVAEILGIEVRPTEKLIARALATLRAQLARLRDDE